MAKIDWIIHCCANGVVCDGYNKVETGFLQYACNAHTHGMERYHHMDFQMVLFLPLEEIGRILNTLGLRVQAGGSGRHNTANRWRRRYRSERSRWRQCHVV